MLSDEMAEFHIPLSREELTQRGERRQYVVTERCTVNDLAVRLDGESTGHTQIHVYTLVQLILYVYICIYARHTQIAEDVLQHRGRVLSGSTLMYTTASSGDVHTRHTLTNFHGCLSTGSSTVHMW